MHQLNLFDSDQVLVGLARQLPGVTFQLYLQVTFGLCRTVKNGMV